MKKITKSISIIAFLLLSVNAWAKTETITIKSSIVCEMCESNIRNAFAYEKGVKRITFNLDNAEITVKYNPKQTSPETIKKKISALGYDADEVKANEAAFNKLNECCKSKEKCEAGHDDNEHEDDEHSGGGHDAHDHENHSHGTNPKK